MDVRPAAAGHSTTGAAIVEGHLRRLALATGLLIAATLVVLRLGAPVSSLPVPSRGAGAAGLTSLPQTLQSVASASVGAGEPAYAFARRGSSSYEVRNPAQGLRATFGASGVELRANGDTYGLALAAVGSGTLGIPATPVRPSAEGNVLSYRHPGVIERWANGPLGLEQSFDVASAPGASRGELTLAIRLSANAYARLANAGRDVLLGSGGAPVLKYGSLTATDADGRSLVSRFALAGREILIRIGVRRASFPVHIDPLVQLTTLKAKGAVGAPGFGFSVSLDSEGATAIVGGTDDNGGVGAAWVFVKSGSKWTEQAKLTGSEEIGAGAFGSAVALSSEGGNTALVGGYLDNKGSGKEGAAWVFTRSGTTWTQQAKLTAKESSLLGESVALSNDGSTALVGDPHEASGGDAWVFQRSGSTWSSQARLTGAEETVPQVLFGESVALSGDGSTALVGGPENKFTEGGAWVFTRSGTSWSQQGPKLFPSDPTTFYDYFGDSVALSSDGNTALIGAPIEGSKEGSPAGATGAGWVFVRGAGKWTQQGLKLTASGETGSGQLGRSAALSSDGNTAVLGAPDDGSNAGAAFAFSRSGGAWTQSSKLTAAKELGEGNAGRSVAVSEGGATALIGGPDSNADAGSAWIFHSEPTSITSVKLKALSNLSKSPTVTVTGTGFGSEPTAYSAAKTSCAEYGPANGDWWGLKPENHLWFIDQNTFEEWSAGAGNAEGGDCIGIVVKKWTPTKVVFKFGNAYGGFAHWTVFSGDEYKLAVAGVLWTGKAS